MLAECSDCLAVGQDVSASTWPQEVEIAAHAVMKMARQLPWRCHANRRQVPLRSSASKACRKAPLAHCGQCGAQQGLQYACKL